MPTSYPSSLMVAAMASNALPAMIDSLAANLTLMGIDPERALVHAGNGAFLRQKLRDKCLQPANSKRPTLTLLTTGGSMTAGSMNCLAAQGVICDARRIKFSKTWSVKLSSLLSRALPGCNVVLQSMVRPAGMSTTLLREMHHVEKLQPDITIEDFTINDVKGKIVFEGRVNNSNALRQVIGAHELLARSMWKRQTPLIMTEAFPNFHVSDFHCQPHLEYAHATISAAYALPVVSFMRAICNESATAARSRWPVDAHWRAGCDGPDSPGFRCYQHPGPHTHSIYASLLAWYILRQGAAALAAKSTVFAAAHGREGYLLLPTSELPAPTADGPFVLSQNELTELQGCSTDTLSSFDFSQSCKGPQRQLNASGVADWSCYEDVPGKLGWTANSTRDRAVRTLSVPVRTTVYGFVVIGFLRSYEGIGRISLYLNGDQNRSVILDGHWDEDTSQTQFKAIRLTELVNDKKALGNGHHNGRRTIHLRMPPVGEELTANGGAESTGKFKVVFLSTC